MRPVKLPFWPTTVAVTNAGPSSLRTVASTSCGVP